MRSTHSWGFLITSLSVVWLLASCRDHRRSRMEFPRDFSSEQQELLRGFDIHKGTSIEMCDVGAYRVGVMTDHKAQAMLVFRGNELLFSTNAQGTTMFAQGRSLATLLHSSDAAGMGDFLYEGYDPRTGARVTVFDSDLDGQPELRASVFPNKRVVSEFWFRNRWQPLVKQGNTSGLIVDGKFMTVSELREALRSGQKLKSR